jgi:hypothetical protein
VNSPASCAATLFDPLRHWLEQFPAPPGSETLNALVDRRLIIGANRRPLRFVPPQADGLIYERRIWECGEVETRPDNWHDFFNALVWLTFPQSKIAVSARHVGAMTQGGATRGRVRDALTHFDECGIVVLSAQPELLELLRNFEWKELFVAHRDDVRKNMRFVVFGHGTYESLRKPFRGLTAKAILYDVDSAWLQRPLAAQVAAVDSRLAGDLANGDYAQPGDFQPLPLLGIPGLTPASENPAYYDDTWQFRPRRRSPAQ